MYDRDIPPMGIHVPQFPVAWFVATTRRNPVDSSVIDAVHTILKSPEMKQYLTDLGVSTVPSDRSSTDQFMLQYRSTLQRLPNDITIK